MELSNSMKQQLCSVVDESIRGYEFTPLVLDMIRFLLRSIYGGLILFDKEQKIQFMDKSSEDLLGLEPGGAKNLEIKDLVSAEEKDLVSAEEIEKTIFAGLPVIGVRGPKGQKRIIVKFPLKKNGKVIGAIGRGVFHNLEEIDVLHLGVYAEQTCSLDRPDYLSRIKQ